MKFDNREDILQITPLWKGGAAFQMAGRRCRTTFCSGCGISRWKRALGGPAVVGGL